MSEKFKVLVPGAVSAPLLKLNAPISFWGGVDQFTGRIIDGTHPQHHAEIGGTVLFVPLIRGSGGTPGNLATLVKFNKAPAAIILGKACINTMTGLLVARELYQKTCPLFLSGADDMAALANGALLQIDETGHYKTGS